MGEFIATLGWPTAWTWAIFAFASGAVASQHVVRAWRQWRFDRRLARNPYMLLEELREHERKMDGYPPPLAPARTVGASLFGGLLAAIPAWLAERHLERWWEYGNGLIIAAVALYTAWRWLNDPPEAHGENALSPFLDGFLANRDAVLGLGAAIGIVLMILLAVFALS